MLKEKIMTREKMGKLLMSTLYIESQLKCILKDILPKDIKLFLNNPFSKKTKHIFNIKNKELFLKIVKKSISLYSNNIDSFSINGIINLIYLTNFIELVIREYNYPLKNNIKFVVNSLQLISVIRNTLAHPKCLFNISKQKLIRETASLKLKKNWTYQKLVDRVYKVEKILNKILKK